MTRERITMARGRGARILCLLVAMAAACGAKKEVDQKVDALIAALAKGDHAAFKAISAPELSALIPEEKFKLFARVTGKLGALQKRAMHGIEVQAGGVHKGSYTLTFTRAEVELDLSTSGGRVIAFNLSGDAVRRAMAELEEEDQAVFKVASFAFVDEKKATRASTTFKRGEELRFRLVVHGMTYREGAIHVKCLLRVYTHENAIKVEKQLLDQTLRPEKKERVVTINGNLKVPDAASPSVAGGPAQPGTYRLQLTVTDVHGGNRTLEHSQAFTVE